MNTKMQVTPYRNNYVLTFEASGQPVIVEAFKILHNIDIEELFDQFTEYGMFLIGTTFKVPCFKTKDNAQKALDYFDSYILMKRLNT